jgi:agmatinase
LPVTETRGLAIRELGILKLDAHPGLRKKYLGEGNNLAPAMSRAMCVVAPERVYEAGIRSGVREVSYRKAPNLYSAHAAHPVETVRNLLPALRPLPLYVTTDVDLLDPPEAPSAGAPEPYGIIASELIVIFRLFETRQIAGIDLMEVAHTFDLSGRAGITAPWILHEGILM